MPMQDVDAIKENFKDLTALLKARKGIGGPMLHPYFFSLLYSL